MIFRRRKKVETPPGIDYEQRIKEAEERLTILLSQAKKATNEVIAAKRDLDRTIAEARSTQRQLRR